MIPKREVRLTTVLMATVVLALSACSSGTTGGPTASSGSASVANSPAFPSESVPPGVQKDSVLDLNSTKDMTGVVTTVPINKSPYIDHLPDICALIPSSVVRQLGVDTKRLGFRGTQLVSQACTMQASGVISPRYSITVNVYTNNFNEILDPSKVETFDREIRIADQVRGTTMRFKPVDSGDTTPIGNCGVAWGTFFGAVLVDYEANSPAIPKPCDQSVAAARLIAPHLPKSPSEMRPAA